MNQNENTPAISTGLLPTQGEFAMFQTIARSAKASGLYGGDENKIFMVMLAARELGISPLLALNGGIWNIQGKIEISARLMCGMIRRAGHTMEIKGSNTECSIKGKRADNGDKHIEVFTIEMAKRAGLDKSNVWQKYAEDMLYSRCMSRLARRLFPDVIGTAYVEGEIKDSKEPITKEPELQDVDCQDVTRTKDQVNHLEDIDPDLPTEESKITQHDVKCIQDIEKRLTQEQKENFRKNRVDVFGDDAYYSITKSKLPGILSRLEISAKANEKGNNENS